MKYKLLTGIIIGVFLISFASAGIFDWLIGSKDKVEPYKPAFNISDTFNTKKISLDKSQICIKNLNDQTKIVKLEKCKKDKVKYTLIDISDSNYFYTNDLNIMRFKNE